MLAFLGAWSLNAVSVNIYRLAGELPKIRGLDLEPQNERALMVRTPTNRSPDLIETAI